MLLFATFSLFWFVFVSNQLFVCLHSFLGFVNVHCEYKIVAKDEKPFYFGYYANEGNLHPTKDKNRVRHGGMKGNEVFTVMNGLPKRLSMVAIREKYQRALKCKKMDTKQLKFAVGTTDAQKKKIIGIIDSQHSDLVLDITKYAFVCYIFFLNLCVSVSYFFVSSFLFFIFIVVLLSIFLASFFCLFCMFDNDFFYFFVWFRYLFLCFVWLCFVIIDRLQPITMETEIITETEIIMETEMDIIMKTKMEIIMETEMKQMKFQTIITIIITMIILIILIILTILMIMETKMEMEQIQIKIIIIIIMEPTKLSIIIIAIRMIIMIIIDK